MPVPERSSVDRIAVERLLAGDFVRAIEHGPIGKVTNADCYGWTIVSYGRRHSREATMPYKHKQDRLILLNAS
jgi:hypothetical protein